MPHFFLQQTAGQLRQFGLEPVIEFAQALFGGRALLLQAGRKLGHARLCLTGGIAGFAQPGFELQRARFHLRGAFGLRRERRAFIGKQIGTFAQAHQLGGVGVQPLAQFGDARTRCFQIVRQRHALGFGCGTALLPCAADRVAALNRQCDQRDQQHGG